MPRPHKKGLDWFQHDCDSSHDEKVESLCAIYGHHEAYSIIFRLFERIYRSGGRLDVSDAETIQILSRNLAKMDVPKFGRFLNSCTKVNIFDRKLYKENKILSSNGILKRVKPVIDKRKKMSAEYKANDIIKKVSGRFSAAETTKEEKRREKNRKEKKILPSEPKGSDLTLFDEEDIVVNVDTKFPNNVVRESSGSRPERKDRKKPAKEVVELMEYFYLAYDKKFEVSYHGKNFRQEYDLFDRLMKEGLTSESIKQKINSFFVSDDKFVKDSSYNPFVFRAVINTLDTSGKKNKIIRL